VISAVSEPDRSRMLRPLTGAPRSSRGAGGGVTVREAARIVGMPVTTLRSSYLGTSDLPRLNSARQVVRRSDVEALAQRVADRLTVREAAGRLGRTTAGVGGCCATGCCRGTRTGTGRSCLITCRSCWIAGGRRRLIPCTRDECRPLRLVPRTTDKSASEARSGYYAGSHGRTWPTSATGPLTSIRPSRRSTGH
jgi:hypothetical protein